MTPIVTGARTYDGPPTIGGLTAWFDQILADQHRLLETNLTLAVAAGDITDVDSVERALAEARHASAQARAQFQQRIGRSVRP